MADMPKTRRGYEPFEVVSALQKAVRRSDVDAALYWGAELFKSGYAGWAWKRLRVIMTEDVGPAMPPGTVADIWALKAFAEEGTRKEKVKDPSAEFFYYAHALVLLCKSPKSRLADNALMQHTTDHVERREIPDEAHDVHTQAGRRQGRGWAHFVAESGRLIQPDEAAQSRGYESMDAEMAALEDRYLKEWLDGRKPGPDTPQNPFSRTTAEKGGKLQPGVKTHFVNRPLGIPMPGTPSAVDNSEGDEEEK